MRQSATGIVYVATKKQRYVAEAFLSACSAKNLIPDIPITLFTNLPDTPYARDDCFDNIVEIDTIRDYGQEWSEGQLDRIRCLPRTPYERTLHLDTDTRVLSPAVGNVFSRLDEVDIALVECAVDNSRSREHYARPMFNVGFILYRKCDKIRRLLDAWAELTAEHFEWASREYLPDVYFLAHLPDPTLRRQLLLMDQLSMVQLLSPEVNRFGLELEILDESWNWRGSRIGRDPPHPVKVDHHPDRRKTLRRDLIRAGLADAEARRWHEALAIFLSLLEATPADARLVGLIVQCCLQLGETDRAAAVVEDLLRISPQDPWAESALESIRARQRGS